MKILRSDFVCHCMVNCLDNSYVPLCPSNYGWKFVDSTWEPIWYDGKALPDFNEIDDIDENISRNEDKTILWSILAMTKTVVMIVIMWYRVMIHRILIKISKISYISMLK